MLRVKKEVDLKELEKFGFEEDDGEYFYENMISLECVYVGLNRNIYIETKSMYYGAIVEDLLYKLFDLIQAGIVEKVEE